MGRRRSRRLLFSDGALGGNAPINVSGQSGLRMTWSGGTFIGPNTVTADFGASITGATAPQYLNGGSLTLSDSTWSGGTILIDNGSILTNSSSLLEATGDNAINRNSFIGTATFLNAGYFVKSNGTGTTSIGNQVTFTNSGTVDVRSGTLAINSALTNTGTVTNALGTTINGSIKSNSGGNVRGVGTYGGPLQFNSGSALYPGLTLGISHGILTTTGAVTMTSGSTFSVQLNGTAPGSGHDQLLLSGTGASINLGGANLLASLGYAPSAADSLTIIAGGPVTGTFVNAPAGQPFVLGLFGGQLYSALLTYNPNSVVIGSFAPVPEPTCILAISMIAVGAVWTIRKLCHCN